MTYIPRGEPNPNWQDIPADELTSADIPRFEKAWGKQKTRELRQPYMKAEAYDPMAGLYGREYQRIMGTDLGRPQEIAAQQRAMDVARRRQQMGAGMMGDWAAGQGMASPLMMRAQQQSLEQQIAQQQGPGAMGMRQSMMAAAPGRQQAALEGMQQAARERVGAQESYAGALGGLRAGDLDAQRLALQQQRQQDAWEQSRDLAALGMLGLGEKEQRARMNAELIKRGAVMPGTAGQGPTMADVLTGHMGAMSAGMGGFAGAVPGQQPPPPGVATVLGGPQGNPPPPQNQVPTWDTWSPERLG